MYVLKQTTSDLMFQSQLEWFQEEYIRSAQASSINLISVLPQSLMSWNIYSYSTQKVKQNILHPIIN